MNKVLTFPKKFIERMSLFDDVETKYCAEFANNSGGTDVEPFNTPQDRADAIADDVENCNHVRSFSSVYLHHAPSSGKVGVECVCDCDVDEDAHLIAFALRELMNTCHNIKTDKSAGA